MIGEPPLNAGANHFTPIESASVIYASSARSVGISGICAAKTVTIYDS